ncbi:hypothetical protein MCO_00840 [Bartonella sp. DB5-6]|uniref:hypothetical protein n=1 Tax=Bartonella sp. DB5-6 TaxID=1094755 RepID=UPI00026E9A10|nr:hypothetical protein [Bartonella sp. DB5-6]EJF77702.1 hypothetical protein MCO_00840 [Bartonella sp. DB5-6]
MKKEAHICRESFAIKPLNSLSYEIVNMSVRILNVFSQEDLAEFKKIMEEVAKTRYVL